VSRKLLKEPQPQLTEFEKVIVDLFKREISVCMLIDGRRGSGKTDIALLIAETLNKFNVISEVSSNIRIYKSHFPINHITNLDDLKLWCESSRAKKLFILDEAGKSLRRRTPMSKLNIKLLDNLQILRKYKLSLIMIAPHERFIDTATLGSDILDARITKISRKVALYVDAYQTTPIEFWDVPRTSIKFDTWDIAPFVEHGTKQKPKFKDRDLEILWDWSHGATVKDLGLHPQQINRLCIYGSSNCDV